MYRTLYTFSAATLLLLLFAATAWSQTATEPSGNGTESDPYLIATLDNLYWVTQNSSSWNKHFLQTDNIDATSTSGWASGSGFLPIGGASPYFTGEYDGDGHVISNLFISRSGSHNVGLFGFATGAVIHKVGVPNATVTGTEYVGALVGRLSNSTLTMSFSTGTVTGTHEVGGLVGFIELGASVSNSYSRATVTASGNYNGGMAGVLIDSESSISNTYSTGSVPIGSSSIGGLLGVNFFGSPVTNSYWDTQTSGRASSGGGTGKTTAQMKTQSTFTGWDFDDVWMIDVSHNDGYPILIWQYVPDITVTDASPSNHALNVETTASIVITFSGALLPTALVDTTTFIVSGRKTGRHKGNIVFSSGNTVATFTPDEPFAYGDLITVQLTSTDHSPYVFTFHTEALRSLGTFDSKVNLETMTAPIALFIGDLDGDGYGDIAVANRNSSTVSIFMNNGDGTFATKQDVATGYIPNAVFGGDLDGDGDIDLAFPNQFDDTVSILLNNGDGTFAAHVDYAAGSQPTSVYIYDLDGDGDNDVVVTNYESDTVSIFMNNGNGTFATKVDVATGDSPYSVFISDLDGDGYGDLAVANLFSHTVSILMNNGDGTFAAKVDVATGSNPNSVFIYDLDADGDGDLAVANSSSNNISILKNNGDGTFAPRNDIESIGGNSSIFVSDIDGDGHGDLVVAVYSHDRVHVFPNNGDGTFAAHTSYAVEDETYAVFVSDLDNDGDGDFVAANHSSANISILYNIHMTLEITGDEGWRMMTPPGTDLSYGDLLRGFWTQGFTGAAYPGGTSNVYTWNEATQSYVSIADAGTEPAPGTGYIVYVYDDQDNDGTPDGFPKSVRWPRIQNASSINAPVTWTDSGSPAMKGWNLIGNPFGATINWGAPSGWTKTNLDAAFYVWDHSSGGIGSYLSWNGSSGTLPDGKIAPWQGFWVKANAAPALSMTTAVQSTGGVFHKENPMPQLTLELVKGAIRNQAIVMFNEQADIERDGMDAYKLASLNANFLSLYTQLSDGTALDINALPADLSDIVSIPLDIAGSNLNGEYELGWSLDAFPSDWVLTLKDNHTGVDVNLTESTSITFQVEESAKKEIDVDPGVQSPEHKMMSPRVMKAAEGASTRFTLTIHPGTTVSTEPGSQLPKEFGLSQNFPNPFNPSTVIGFQLPVDSRVDLQVYDMLGRQVATLASGQMNAGRHSVTFNAENLASGMYIYRLVAGNTVLTKKLTLIK